MVSPALRCILCLFLVACVSGCADVIERTKTPESRPPIVEEDVPRESTPNPEIAPGQQSTSQADSLPQALPQNLPQAGDRSTRPPRHLIWQDRRESGETNSGSGVGN